jgi:hypothetical protein
MKNLQENFIGLCCISIQSPMAATSRAPGFSGEPHGGNELTAEERDRHGQKMCEELHEKNVCY